MTTYVTERDGLKGLAVARGHVANNSETPPAALAMVGAASIDVASSSLARELFNYANLKTTARYAHVLDGEVADAMERAS